MSVCVYFILQYRSNSRSVLAKIWVEKQVNSHYFLPFMSCILSVLKNKTCILHHFTFLDWSPPHIFITPNYPLFTPKNPLFNDYFAPFSHVFHSSKGLCLYHLRRIFMPFAAHFAPFHLAFCTKIACV